MSLRENFARKREEKKQEEETLREKLEQKRQFNEAREKIEEQSLIKNEIEELRKKKEALIQERDKFERLISDLNSLYKEASDAQGRFKESSKQLDDIFAEYQDILNDMGIKTKGDLLKNVELGEEKESLEYKKAAEKRRDSVKELAKLKEKRPDLSFRGGKIEGEEKSPRALSFETMNLELKKMDQDIKSVDREIKNKSSQVDKNPEEFLMNLSREEFNKEFDKAKGQNHGFYINNKPGVTITYNLLDLGDQYGDKIVKKMLMDEIVSDPFYYDGNIRNKNSLEDNIDFLWLAGSISKKLNGQREDSRKLLDYLSKKNSLEKTLSSHGKVSSEMSPDIQLTVTKSALSGRQEIFHNFFNLGEEIRKPFNEKRDEHIKEIGDLVKKDEHIVTKDSIFDSKSKKQKARSRYDFFNAFTRNVKDLNFYREIDKNIIDQAGKLKQEEILSAEEYEKILDFFKYYQRTSSDYKELEQKSNNINQSINYLNDININFVIENYFSVGEKLDTQTVLLRMEKALEDLKEQGKSSGLDKEGDDLKKMFYDLADLIDKNVYNINQHSFERYKTDFLKYFPSEPEIYSKLNKLVR